MWTDGEAYGAARDLHHTDFITIALLTAAICAILIYNNPSRGRFFLKTIPHNSARRNAATALGALAYGPPDHAIGDGIPAVGALHMNKDIAGFPFRHAV